MDSYGNFSNGTTATARRFANCLRKRGHTVRVLAANSKEAKGERDFYPVTPFKVPIFQPLIDKQGFTFAKADREVIYKAIKGADLVHLFLPFPLEVAARRTAEQLNIPVTAAFHLQPENVTYTLYMGKNKSVNNRMYYYLYDNFYRYVKHIHCPSKMIANQLKKHHYDTNITHVISNGVVPAFKSMDVAKPEKFKDKYVILMVGRLSREKRQDLIIKAIGRSKYNKRIQLILCGQGPQEKIIRKLSKKHLINPVEIKFVKQSELVKIINYSDLYIHSSDAEIEAIACIEAFTCGIVPVISDSPISATNQFALFDKCLFKNGNYKSLQHRIDYWIEHPAVKAEYSKKYIEYAKQFAIENEVTKLEKVFADVIKENDLGKAIPQVQLSKSQMRKNEKFEEEMQQIIEEIERDKDECIHSGI